MSTSTDLNANEAISTELAVTEPKTVTITIENVDSTSTETTPTTTTTSAPTTPKPVQKVQKKKDNRTDPARFEGLGVNFNAKLIGVDSVPDARGDKMCQEKMQQLKIAVRTAGVHKQRIIVNVSEEGIKLIDQRTGVPNYQHAVHRISFISRDGTDSRAFGYVFGDVDGSHKFFAIKTEKAAENLVLTLRDLFQIVYAKKKQEMEEAKKQQKVQEEKKVEEEKKAQLEAEEKAKTVITLGGDLEQESSTDDEPVYQVPQNNGPVAPEESTAGSNLVDLENELQTIGQGIEQMNEFESLFDSMETPDTGSAAPATDPWGVSSSDAPSKSIPKSSSAGDLADLDLFNAPVQKKKEDILSLFGPSVPPAAQGFGAAPAGFGAAPAPQGFGAAQFPVAGNPGYNAWGPGTPFPTSVPPAGPFAAPGGMPGGMPPPVPNRTNMGGMPPPAASNPFASDPFSSQAGGPVGGGFAAFSNAPSQPPPSSDASLLDQPLMPFKLDNEPTPEIREPQSGKGAFDDLCAIGGKEKSNKAPKDLFADLSAAPKKSINEMMRSKSPSNVTATQPQASDNPFGTLDRNVSLPAAFDFSSPFSPTAEDPFDTSFLDPSKPPQPNVAKASPIAKEKRLNLNLEKSGAKNNKNSDSESNSSDENDNFDLPSPDNPPPPLPVEKPPETAFPILPPRPAVGNVKGQQSKEQLPSSVPKLPPRNHVTGCTKTEISSIPRPRPRASLNNKGDSLPSVPPRPERNVNNSPSKFVEKSDKSMNNSDKAESGQTKPVINEQSKTNNNIASPHGRHFVIEDPFKTSDPFADTDPFSSSSDGFSYCDFISANDPFITSHSTTTANYNGNMDNGLNDDPFAVFDNCLNDSFNFKNSSRKSSKSNSSSKKNNPNDPFGGVPFQANGQEALYATVNKPKK